MLAPPYEAEELASFVERRKRGITKHSMDWVDRASRDLWQHPYGVVSKHTMDNFARFVLAKYRSQDSHVKDLGFAKAFLKCLTKTRLDTRYYAFELFLERPRAIKERKDVTNRIITRPILSTS